MSHLRARSIQLEFHCRPRNPALPSAPAHRLRSRIQAVAPDLLPTRGIRGRFPVTHNRATGSVSPPVVLVRAHRPHQEAAAAPHLRSETEGGQVGRHPDRCYLLRRYLALAEVTLGWVALLQILPTIHRVRSVQDWVVLAVAQVLEEVSVRVAVRALYLAEEVWAAESSAPSCRYSVQACAAVRPRPASR